MASIVQGIIAPVSAQPENDRCSGAFAIQLGVPVTSNNFLASSDFSNQAVCGPRSDGRAVWFAIQGTGKILTASVCSENTETEPAHLGVFNQCENRDCNGWAHADLPVARCSYDEVFSYTWNSVANATYFLHVRGLGNVSFRLVVTDEPTAENESCDDAIKIDPGSTTVASTAGSAFDFLPMNTCGIGSDLPGIWYMVEGNGQIFTISMCSKTEVPISFGVFDSCDRASCHGHSSHGIALCDHDDTVEYSWSTQFGMNYFVHVRGAGAAQFIMKVTTASLVVNNDCFNSIPVELGVEVVGTNGGSSFDFVDEGLCGARSDLPAVWYEVVGNGFEYVATVCTTTVLPVNFGVFQGCDKRNCVGSSEEAIAYGCSTYSFHTFIGEKYHFQVRGDDGIGFKLTVAESSGPSRIEWWCMRSVVPLALHIFLWK